MCVSLRRAAIDYPRTALCGAHRLDAPPHPRSSLLRCHLPSACSSCGGYCRPLSRPLLCASAACELTLKISRDPRSPFPSSSNTAISGKCYILPLIASTTSPSPTFLLKLCTSANQRGDGATALRFSASRCRTLSSPLPSVQALPHPPHRQHRPTYH